MKCNACILFRTRGAVRVNGTDVAGPSARIGYMPQQDYLFDWRTVIDNVLLGAENQGVDLSSAKRQAMALET
jgi:NitT/TauT family transport system ATP-binding protein